MDVEYTTGEVLAVLQTEKLKYLWVVIPLGMFGNNNFSSTEENH